MGISKQANIEGSINEYLLFFVVRNQTILLLHESFPYLPNVILYAEAIANDERNGNIWYLVQYYLVKKNLVFLFTRPALKQVTYGRCSYRDIRIGMKKS